MFVYGSFHPDADAVCKEVATTTLWNLVEEYTALCARAIADHEGTEDDMEDFIEKVENDHSEAVRDVMCLLMRSPDTSYIDQDGKEVQGDLKEFIEKNKYLVVVGEEALYCISEDKAQAEQIYDKVNEIANEPGWYTRINGDSETGLFAQ